MAMLVTLLTQTTKWEVVKICASPKRPFFFFSKKSIVTGLNHPSHNLQIGRKIRRKKKEKKKRRKKKRRKKKRRKKKKGGKKKKEEKKKGGKKKRRKKKKGGKKKVSLHRFEPGPLTLMDIGRYAWGVRTNVVEPYWIRHCIRPDQLEKFLHEYTSP